VLSPLDEKNTFGTGPHVPRFQQTTVPSHQRLPSDVDTGVDPSAHRSESRAMDLIYTNRMIPLGKMKVMPAKKAKKDAGTKPIGDPYSIFHTQHVKYDVSTRQYQGLPPEWEAQLKQQFNLPPNRLETMKLPEYKGRIPSVLVQMKEYLVSHGGLEVEGIFRLAPDADESSYVKRQINQNSFQECRDVNIISNLIKVWLRELPTHLLDDARPEDVQSCDSEEQAGIIVNELTDPYQSILLWLIDLCLDVSKLSHVNKMTAQNLAIVIGPNLFSPTKATADPMQSLLYSQKVANFFYKAILWRKKSNIHRKLSM